MNETIRILHVVTTMNQGGAETMLINYYRHIDRTKVQFDFLVHRPEEGAYEAEILALGGKIHRLPALSLKTAYRYPTWIRQFLNNHPEYNAIHIHSSGVAYFVAKAAHKLGRKMIIQHSHACARDIFDLTTPIRFFCKVATRRYLTHFFSCGKEAAEWLFGKKGAENATILPNAIDATKYRYSPARHIQLKERFGWNDKLVIGNVARFCYPKNHFQLLEIFQATLAIQPNAHLVLVGKKDGYYAELKNKIKKMGLEKHVEFTGARSDIPDLLNAFDIFLFPSLFEGLSVAMIEAQATGLKIIASDAIAREVAICPDLVEFLSLSEPLSTWAKQLTQNYERRDTYQKICSAGYDIKNNANKLLLFYIQHIKK